MTWITGELTPNGPLFWTRRDDKSSRCAQAPIQSIRDEIFPVLRQPELHGTIALSVKTYSGGSRTLEIAQDQLATAPCVLADSFLESHRQGHGEHTMMTRRRAEMLLKQIARMTDHLSVMSEKINERNSKRDVPLVAPVRRVLDQHWQYMRELDRAKDEIEAGHAMLTDWKSFLYD